MGSETYKTALERVKEQDAAQLHDILQRLDAAVPLDVRQVLEATAKVLDHADHQLAVQQERFNQALESAVRKGRETLRIETCLAPAEEEKALSASGLYPMLLPEERASGLCFWNMDYQAFCKLLQQRFHGRLGGKDVIYKFVYAPEFCKAEKMIFRVAELYGLASPCIFSPWARRATRVRIQTADSLNFVTLKELRVRVQQEDALDLCLEKNHLEEAFLPKQTIYWNLCRSRVPETVGIRSVPGVAGDMYEFRYKIPDADSPTFILPPKGCTIEALEHEIVVTGTEDWWRQTEGAYDVFTWHPLQPSEMVPQLRFANTIREGWTCGYGQLRTEAQLANLIGRYGQPGFSVSCDERQAISELHEIPLYENRMSYPSDRTQVLFRRRLQQEGITLRFSCTEDASTGQHVFLADYANFVLEDLSRRFPSILWKGMA